mmetsp:Transcript_21399/g.52431  ORF Transcript_21399/g.52431 Transcript_21399/m.52431 type:complete len:106 (+) Transcript_21399:31-348(+)
MIEAHLGIEITEALSETEMIEARPGTGMRGVEDTMNLPMMIDQKTAAAVEMIFLEEGMVRNRKKTTAEEETQVRVPDSEIRTEAPIESGIETAETERGVMVAGLE